MGLENPFSGKSVDAKPRHAAFREIVYLYEAAGPDLAMLDRDVDEDKDHVMENRSVAQIDEEEEGMHVMGFVCLSSGSWVVGAGIIESE